MSVEMKLGIWQARDGTTVDIVGQFPRSYMPWVSRDGIRYYPDGRYLEDQGDTPQDLIRYLGPIELSPSPACAEAGPAGDPQTVSTEDPQESLRRMRAHCNALDRWLSAYKALVAQNERTKDDLEEAIKMLEKEVGGVITKTPEKCPKCGCEMTVECDGRLMHVGRNWRQDDYSFCLERQRDQLAERVKELEDVRDLALDTLKMVASNIRNELVSREVAGRSANQWPDVLNGCVSGGGVEAAIEALEKTKGPQ